MWRIFQLEILIHSMPRMSCLELHVFQCPRCFQSQILQYFKSLNRKFSTFQIFHLETFNASSFRISNVPKFRISKLLNSSSIGSNMKNFEVADFQARKFSNTRISKQRPRNERSWTSHYCVTRKRSARGSLRVLTNVASSSRYPSMHVSNAYVCERE